MFTVLPLFDFVYCVPDAVAIAPFSALGQTPEVKGSCKKKVVFFSWRTSKKGGGVKVGPLRKNYFFTTKQIFLRLPSVTQLTPFYLSVNQIENFSRLIIKLLLWKTMLLQKKKKERDNNYLKKDTETVT